MRFRGFLVFGDEDYSGRFNFELRIPYRKYVRTAAVIQILKIV